MIDYSQEHDLLWIVFLNQNGECWTFPNAEVRMVSNFSLGRYVSDCQPHNSFGTGNPARQHGSVLDNREHGPTPGTETKGGAVEAPSRIP